MDSRPRPAHRPASRLDAKPANRRRGHHAADPSPPIEAASARAAVRRQRLDGALLAHAAALRSRPRASAWAARGVSLRDRADACDRQIRLRRLQEAVDAVSDVVPDWSGGTRIGPALRQFHQRWARRVLHQAPVVLLISDGWDRGDPQVLREQVARLQRSCHRLIWLNPLIGTVDYAPLTRGLQAALPYVDDFLAARTLADLADLAVHLSAVASQRTFASPACTHLMDITRFIYV